MTGLGVNELRDEIGADSFDEVAEMFLDEADEAVQRLDLGRGAKALEADLHFLKGSALNLGFSDLSELCHQGERAASLGRLDFDLSALTRVYQASKTAFAAGLAARLSA